MIKSTTGPFDTESYLDARIGGEAPGVYFVNVNRGFDLNAGTRIVAPFPTDLPEPTEVKSVFGTAREKNGDPDEIVLTLTGTLLGGEYVQGMTFRLELELPVYEFSAKASEWKRDGEGFTDEE